MKQNQVNVLLTLDGHSKSFILEHEHKVLPSLMRMVVDTSTIIAVIADEPERPRLVEITKNATIVAPPSIDWEVGNAFSAMLKRSRITLAQALEALEIYREIVLEIVEIDLQQAIRLASKYNIYAYDAYILQCAIEQDLPIVSLDDKLIEVAKREGIKVIEVNI